LVLEILADLEAVVHPLIQELPLPLAELEILHQHHHHKEIPVELVDHIAVLVVLELVLVAAVAQELLVILEELLHLMAEREVMEEQVCHYQLLE